MKRMILWLTLAVSSVVAMCAADNDTLSVMEPLSQTEFRLPSATVDTIGSAFFKGGYTLPDSYLMLYSMRNNKEEKFSWSELNGFEKERRLGRRIKEIRLPDIDAWQRVFESDSRGLTVFHCLTIVNGNGYAMYILENAIDSARFSSPAIIADTEFRDMQGVRIARQILPEWVNALIYTALLLLMALLTYFVNKNKWPRWPLVAFDVVFTISIFVYLYCFEMLTILLSSVFAGLFAFAVTMMIFSKTNRDLEDTIGKVLKMFSND